MLVTGASSGIGRAIALAAAQAGADVALTYRSNEAAPGTWPWPKSRVWAGGRWCCSSIWPRRSRWPLSGRAALAALGRLDAWMNNAGADILTGPTGELSRTEKLDLLLAVDLRGTVLASWHAAELLARNPHGGVIVNVSWDHVLTGMQGINPQMYSAVKGGILSFSKSLARSVAPRVRVNVVAPGWIETAFGEGLDEKTYAAVAASTPLQRWGTPEDVAGSVIFLASPAAKFLTGQTILVGGGVVM